MLKVLKNNYRQILILAMIILGLYWYEYRPMRVKQHCISWAAEKAKSSSGDQTDVRYFFWKCSNDYGI